MPTDVELQDFVTEALVDTLAVDPEEVTPSARLFNDLGAESIDILDLSFRLEKKLGFPVHLDKALSPTEFQTDSAGKLTAESLAVLQQRFPSLKIEGDRQMSGIDGLRELLTVEVIVGYLKQKLKEPRP